MRCRSSQLRTLWPFEICVGNFRKNPVATERKNLDLKNSVFFCKLPYLISMYNIILLHILALFLAAMSSSRSDDVTQSIRKHRR